MLVRRAGGDWQPPKVGSYANEAELQQLVSDSPHLVGATVPAVALRELPLRDAGNLDVLLIDIGGGLTLVEAKLNRNAEIRRAVVGQLLGYAGGLWGMAYDDLDAAVQSRHGASLMELAALAAADTDVEADEFRERVADNLRRGAFRLVFAVDEISEDLKRAVEYLNAHTLDDLEIVVLELGYSKVDDLEILIPTRFGEESARRKHVARRSPRWNENTFFEALEQHATDEELVLARRFFEWARPRVSSISWGDGAKPACNFVFDAPEGAIQPCRLVLTARGLLVRVNFDLARKRPRPALEAMLELLSTLPAIAAVQREVLDADFTKRPAIWIEEAGEEGVAVLTEALQAMLDHPVDTEPVALE
jgi:hypothetical protein